MRLVTAGVISNEQILEKSKRPNGRKVLSVNYIWLDCPEIAAATRPGQFVMVNCGTDCTLPRPFSIHRVNDKGEMALYYNVWDNGKGTGWLSQCQTGDTISIFGPLGNHFTVSPESENLLLVAGGIGIAPLVFLAGSALKDGKQVTLIMGTPTSHNYPEGLLPKEIKLVTVTEDGSVGKKGLATDLITDYLDRADQIFACGPMPMYRAMAALPSLNGRPVQISLEVVLGCGVGVCYGCTVKTKNGLKQACTDGPVFDLDDILWDWLD